MAGDIRLFEERTGKYVDALYAVLVASDELQFFPEMVDICGENMVLTFLDIFAGQTITVPPRDVIEAKVRDVSMWLEFTEGGEKSIPQIAKDHGLCEAEVRDRITGIVNCLERVGVKTCPHSAKSAERPSEH